MRDELICKKDYYVENSNSQFNKDKTYFSKFEYGSYTTHDGTYIDTIFIFNANSGMMGRRFSVGKFDSIFDNIWEYFETLVDSRRRKLKKLNNDMDNKI
jgi:hypothetical protein